MSESVCLRFAQASGAWWRRFGQSQATFVHACLPGRAAPARTQHSWHIHDNQNYPWSGSTLSSAAGPSGNHSSQIPCTWRKTPAPSAVGRAAWSPDTAGVTLQVRPTAPKNTRCQSATATADHNTAALWRASELMEEKLCRSGFLSALCSESSRPPSVALWRGEPPSPPSARAARRQAAASGAAGITADHPHSSPQLLPETPQSHLLRLILCFSLSPDFWTSVRARSALWVCGFFCYCSFLC